MFFEPLFGFDEAQFKYAQVQGMFEVRPERPGAENLELVSLKNGRVFPIGRFSTPTVEQTKAEALALLKNHSSGKATTDSHPHGEVLVTHDIVGDALELHARYPMATIQAAR
jgi:hypothetical protein